MHKIQKRMTVKIWRADIELLISNSNFSKKSFTGGHRWSPVGCGGFPVRVVENQLVE